ncbi:MAG: ABC transporter ATP-binding protein [Bdellovibrionaceae bacterium]|nr:ABC transporter ATP-binding protein [Pseudobdellovibrionaceae bacterium]
MSQILNVSDLNVKYGGIHAIKGISFHVDTQEIVSLIGSNGAGKTSTLRALSGLVSSTGIIEFEGQDITKIPSFERVPLGLAQSPEGRGVFADMTVWENLEMGAYTRKDKNEVDQDREKYLEFFPRLRERIKQLAGTLSGGEQQMLAICRALMSRPKLLLLDEPSLGLAPLIVAQIFEIVQKLNQEGLTILLVEQNATQALKISHRAYVIETGNVILEGTGAELLANDQVRQSYLGA